MNWLKRIFRNKKKKAAYETIIDDLKDFDPGKFKSLNPAVMVFGMSGSEKARAIIGHNIEEVKEET